MRPALDEEDAEVGLKRSYGWGFLAALMLFFLTATSGWMTGPLTSIANRYLGSQFNLYLEAQTLSLMGSHPGLSGSGIVLSARNHEPFLRVDQLQISIDIWHSIRWGRVMLVVGLEHPDLLIARDDEGRLNVRDIRWSQDESSGGFPWVHRFDLNRGHVEIRDDDSSQGRVTSELSVVAFIRPVSDGVAGSQDLELTLTGREDGALSMKGRYDLKAGMLETHWSLQSLDLADWAQVALAGSPLEIEQGKISTPSEIGLRWTHQGPEMIGDAEVSLTGLKGVLRIDETQHWSLDRLLIRGTATQDQMKGVKLPEMIAEGFHLPDRHFERLRIQNATLGVLSDPWGWESMTLEHFRTQAGWSGSLTAGALSWIPDSGGLSLHTMDVSEAVSSFGAIRGLKARELEAQLSTETLHIEELSLEAFKGPHGSLENGVLNHLDLDLGHSEAHIERVGMDRGGLDRYRFQHAEASDFTVDLDALTMRFASLTIPSFETPHGKLSALWFDKPEVDLASGTFTTHRLNIGGANADYGEFSRGSAEELRIDAAKKEVSLKALEMEGVSSQKMVSGKLNVQGVLANWERPWLKLTGLHLLHSNAEAPRAFLPFNSDEHWNQASRFGSFDLENVWVDGRTHQLRLDRLMSSGSEMGLQIGEGGSLRVTGFSAQGSDDQHLLKTSEDWGVKIKQLGLRHTTIKFSDLSTTPHVHQTFNEASLDALDFSTSPQDEFVFKLSSQIGQSGSWNVQGRAHLSPVSASLRFSINNLRLRAIQPYWRPLTGIEVTGGRLNLWGTAHFRHNPALQFDYEGSGSIVDFDSVDAKDRKRFVQWKSLELDAVEASNAPNRLAIRAVTIEEPRLRVALSEHHELNLRNGIKTQSPQPVSIDLTDLAIPSTPKNTLPSFSVGVVRIKDAAVDYADQTIEPGFAADIEDLDGTLTGLTSREDTRSSLSMNGHLNINSPVRLFGSLNPLSVEDYADMNLEFKGFNLTSLQNYAGRFGGYRIERGKIDVLSHYRMEHQELDLSNRYQLDNLTLGDPIDNSDRSLLLDFALWVLKDKQGRIDVDLPITGSLSDPEFSMWQLYGNVAEKLLSKFISSPILLLESPLALVNDDLVPLHQRLLDIRFTPGDPDLDDEDRRRLDAISKTVLDTPGANIEIRGQVAPIQDRHALAKVYLDREILRMRRIELYNQGLRVPSETPPPMEPADYERLVISYFHQHHPIRIQQAVIADPFGELPYKIVLDRVIDQWPVDEVEVTQIGQWRAENIRKYLLEKRGLSDDRIYIATLKRLDSGDSQIRAEMTLIRD